MAVERESDFRHHVVTQRGGEQHMDWSGELIKSVIFPSGEGSPPLASDLWSSVVGAPPNSFQRGQLPGISVAAGTLDHFQIQLLCQPGRLEIALRELDPKPAEPTPQPWIEDLPAALATLRELESKMIAGRTLSRIGVVYQLIKNIDDAANAPDILNAELKRSVFGKSVLEPVVQFNVRTRCAPLGVDINRLCKWGAAALQSAVLAIDVNSKAQSIETIQTQAVIYLHVDVNNVPSDQTFSNTAANELASTLWNEATKVKDGGIDVLS